MFYLRKTEISDLTAIVELGSQEHTKPFLNHKSLAEHKIEFSNKNTTYLSMVDTSDIILGYFILLSDQSNYATSIQLKRILIDKDSLGIGQAALTKLEQYCISVMGIKHIWLNVYRNNYRAIHIYKKLGYQLYNSVMQDNRDVLYFDKQLNQ